MTARHMLGFMLLLVGIIAVPAYAQPGVEVVPPQPLTANQEKAVIVHDPALLADFGFARTIGQIVATGGSSDTQENRVSFVQSLIASFALGSAVNQGVLMPITPRPTEAALKPEDLLNPDNINDGMRPVALINRLDLMPANGVHCGEQRIIYVKGTGLDLTNRMTMIFEGAIENPRPDLGAAGCLPIAQFWSDLRNDNDKARLKKLVNFYYNGVAGINAVPVVHFLHYGNPFGQIRLNTFVNDVAHNIFVDWVLREYRTKKSGNGVIGLKVTPVGETPWRTVYTPVQDSDPDNLKVLKALCQNALATNNLEQVFALELSGDTKPITDQALISQLGVNISGKCDGFESISSNAAANTAVPDPELIENPDLKARLDQAIADKQTQMPYPVRSSMLMNRVNSQACAGCHELTFGQAIAPAAPGGFIAWPASLGFVQIDEVGNLSIILRDRFLPARFQLQKKFINDNALTAQAPGARPVQSPGTIQAVAQVQSLQDSILNGSIDTQTADAQIDAQRIIDRNMVGALVVLRPAD